MTRTWSLLDSMWTLKDQLATLERQKDKYDNEVVELLTIKELLKEYSEDEEVWVYSHTLCDGYINVYAQLDTGVTLMYSFDGDQKLIGSSQFEAKRSSSK